MQCSLIAMTFDGRKGNMWLPDACSGGTSCFVSDVNKRTLARRVRRSKWQR